MVKTDALLFSGLKFLCVPKCLMNFSTSKGWKKRETEKRARAQRQRQKLAEIAQSKPNTQLVEKRMKRTTGAVGALWVDAFFVKQRKQANGLGQKHILQWKGERG